MLEQNGGDVSAEALLTAASSVTGLPREGLPPGDPLLFNAHAVLRLGVVWFDRTRERWEQLFDQAHEYGHYWLGVEGCICGDADLNWEASEDAVPIGVSRVEGYGPHERRELEANVFAREFLLSGDALRQWFLKDGLNASRIANRVGVPEGLVWHQLSRALLSPELPDKIEQPPNSSKLILDDRQKRAAYVAHGPILVDAGPGTGKTSTLTGRVAHLLTQPDARPEQILALTYTNKAAEEMRSRVALIAPDKAQRIWMGTFHAFGLELLRKFWERCGLTEKPKVIDELDAQLLLERSLGSLKLNHYRSLSEPTRYIRDILSAISRAKDELADPIEYTKLAQKMRSQAATPEAVEAAEKALEVAEAYTFYQNLLDKEKLLDYGDLLLRSLKLLRDPKHKVARDFVRDTYRYILVDEYQDVNTVSRLLLLEIADSGEGLWVVGDMRQSIFRFRGAAPINMVFFRSDFTGARVVSLVNNYRSKQPIVDIFAECASRMENDYRDGFKKWKAQRGGDGARVQLKIYDNEEAEAKELSREIERQKQAGVKYRNQAVLCCSHATLTELSSILEREGVPVLYLGDFFTRSEIRDLLSLLSLTCGSNGRGLIRVSKFKEYQIPFEDVQRLLKLAREKRVFFPQALKIAEEAADITPEGKEKLALLYSQLERFHFGSNAWTVLTQYLFEVSDYLRTIVADDSVEALRKMLAIYQLLRFAYQLRERFNAEDIDPKQAFLDYVRRLKSSGEEKQLRQTPTWADDIDAVRMLTVHSSKGLEFDVVYLPNLVNGRFPFDRRYEPCPPPVGLLPDAMGDWHREEEQSLFFVALSRARNELHLSHARQYNDRLKAASSLLSLVRRSLSRVTSNLIATTRRPPVREEIAPKPPEVLPVYTSHELDTYIECPRKYFYKYVLNLGGRGDESEFLQSHSCVHRVWQWIEDELKQGHDINEKMVWTIFTDFWEKYGPRNHAYKDFYKQDAELMVLQTLERRLQSEGIRVRPEWELQRPYGRILVRPDYVELTEDNDGPLLVIERLRIGSPPRKMPNDAVFSLYFTAAEQEYPDVKHKVQVLYVSTNKVREIDIQSQQCNEKLLKYDRAMIGILQKNFRPSPNNKKCSQCPHFFICTDE